MIQFEDWVDTGEEYEAFALDRRRPAHGLSPARPDRPTGTVGRARTAAPGRVPHPSRVGAGCPDDPASLRWCCTRCGCRRSPRAEVVADRAGIAGRGRPDGARRVAGVRAGRGTATGRLSGWSPHRRRPRRRASACWPPSSTRPAPAPPSRTPTGGSSASTASSCRSAPTGRWSSSTATQAVNDHADAAYDAAVLDRLGTLHVGHRLRCSRPGGGRCDAFGRYGRRLRRRPRHGSRRRADWFTKPTIDSYHTVWFELHEDLLATLGPASRGPTCGRRATPAAQERARHDARASVAVITAMVTPFDDDGDLDLDAAADLARWLVEHGQRRPGAGRHHRREPDADRLRGAGAVPARSARPCHVPLIAGAGSNDTATRSS